MLLVDGRPTGIALEGLQLVDQFETGSGYLLVTDYNDPWEEQTVVSLLDADLKQVAKKRLGKFLYVFPSRTFSVKSIDIEGGALVLQGSSAEEGRYRVEVTNVPGWLGARVGLRTTWHQS
ncbi:MAG: hypothetical protein I8H88_04535 [Burkholderiales bacterium]|nr:hypothetical protein [Burkholderiales bacterium]